MRFPSVTLRLPGWVGGLILDPDRGPTPTPRTGRGSRSNSPERAATAERGTFRRSDLRPGDEQAPRPRCLAPGVNLVLAPGYSFAHVKMVAILVAHQLGGDFDLGGEGQPPYELIASTEPCSMYFGAVPWFGVRHLVRGARGEDAEAAGFDEGPKPLRVGAYARRARHRRRAHRAPQRGSRRATGDGEVGGEICI